MKKNAMITALTATLALTLAACGGASSGSEASASASSATPATGATSTSATGATSTSATEATSTSATDDTSSTSATATGEVASDSTSAAALSGNISALSDWSQELYDARLSTQETMKTVMNDWDANSPEAAIEGGQAGLDEAYQAALAEIAARHDEGLAAIDATSDPDEVKEYWKADVEDEYQQYLEGMEKSYENAKAFVM